MSFVGVIVPPSSEVSTEGGYTLWIPDLHIFWIPETLRELIFGKKRAPHGML